jgi:hypothetical protein
MADTVVPDKHQSLREIRQWDIDYSLDLQVGVTVSSATATHIPPSGAASTPTVGVIVDDVVPVTLGPLTVTGKHTLLVLATYSNAERSEVRININVDY